MTKQIPWNTGDGNITLTYNGQGNDSVIVDSDINEDKNSREQVLTFSGGGIARQVTVRQGACPLNYKSYDGYYIKTADSKYMCVPPYRELVDANGDNFLTKNNEQFIC